MSDPVLQVRDLKKWFPIRGGTLISRHVGDVKAVDGVSFDVFSIFDCFSFILICFLSCVYMFLTQICG